MNKLLGMLAFARVVESGGFTGAAKRLGLSVSAITKNVSRLEAELGTQLLTRTTRRLAVTEFGREYYASCRRIFDEIDNVENSLQQSQRSPRGKLRILCPAFFARVTLLPRLHEFYKKYPNVELDIGMDENYSDLIDAGVDLAVIAGDLKDSRFTTRNLVRGPRVCCASPEYLRKHGTPKTLDDLMSHNCLVSRSSLWQFKESDKAVEIEVKGNLTLRSGDALREATLRGLGITQSNWWVFRQDIADGTLVEFLKEYRAPGRPISLIYPPTRFVSRKLRVMIDFLVEITRTTQNN